MVTTRRTPGTTAGNGRANATLPKVPKARLAAQAVPPAAAVDESRSDATKKGKHKTKATKAHHKKHKKPKTWTGGFIDLVSRLALLWFTIYTLSVCPDDDALQSPICRGLYHYRELVLEPYVFPPLQRALAHPAVAPYVDAVRPHVEHAIEVGTPLALQARDSFNAHVVPQWDKRVVPAYNQYVVPAYYNHVLPQWHAHVVPQWHKHVQPVYEAHLAPYVRQAEAALGPYYADAVFAYHTHLVPGAQVAATTLHRWQVQAQPYAVLAANKAAEGYVAAKPYAAPVWAKVKDVLADVLALLAVQRRKFVDPHLVEIWDRVVELSGSKVGPKIARAPAAVRESASSISSVAASASWVVSSAASSMSKSASSAVSSASSAASSASSSIASSASSKASSASSVVTSKISTMSSVAASSASSVSSVVSSSVAPVKAVTESAIASASEVLPQVRETTSPNPHTTVTESVASSASASASSGVASVAGQASSSVSKASSAATQATSSVVSAASSLAAEAAQSAHSAKDAAETVAAAAADAVREAASSASLKASVAAKQAASSVSSVATQATPALTGTEDDEDDLADFLSDLGFSEDHTPLEDEAIEETEAQSPAPPAPETEEERTARLEKVADKRKAIMDRHAQWEAQLADETKRQNREVRKSLLNARKKAAAELHAHAEIRLAVDGLAAEADKLIKGAEGFLKNLNKEGKPAAEKAALWTRIGDKIEAKFTKRVQEVEKLVNGWYDGVNQQELNLVFGHTEKVLFVANSAQESLGLDYVWLDDVTYHDWQRYHDLMRVYEAFTDKALAVQNGTWAKPIKNVVQDAIEELETEVAGVVGAFETRMTRLNEDGARAFADSTEDVKVPDVSIPVTPPAETAPGAQAVPPVLVGRGKEEVAEALGRVEAQEVTETLPPTTPDADKSADELVGEIADEAAGLPKNVHVEL